jgi:hypothetical protein
VTAPTSLTPVEGSPLPLASQIQRLRRPPSHLLFVVALVAAEAVWLSFLGFVIVGLIR